MATLIINERTAKGKKLLNFLEIINDPSEEDTCVSAGDKMPKTE